MQGFALPVLMGLIGDDSSGSNQFLSYIFFSQFATENGNNISDNKRLQTLFLAPLAKRFRDKLAKRLLKLSEEDKARLMASLIAFVLAQRQEGEMANLLEMVAMSGITNLFNSAGASAIIDTEARVVDTSVNNIGGVFRGILTPPKEEVKKMNIEKPEKPKTGEKKTRIPTQIM